MKWILWTNLVSSLRSQMIFKMKRSTIHAMQATRHFDPSFWNVRRIETAGLLIWMRSGRNTPHRIGVLIQDLQSLWLSIWGVLARMGCCRRIPWLIWLIVRWHTGVIAPEAPNQTLKWWLPGWYERHEWSCWQRCAKRPHLGWASNRAPGRSRCFSNWLIH